MSMSVVPDYVAERILAAIKKGPASQGSIE